MSQFNLLISTHKYKQLFYKSTTFPPFFYLSILIPLFFSYPPPCHPRPVLRVVNAHPRPLRYIRYIRPIAITIPATILIAAGIQDL